MAASALLKAIGSCLCKRELRRARSHRKRRHYLAKMIANKREIARQTPRVSVTVRRIALARQGLGQSELKLFRDWNDGRPETELNFKFYRQATNKIAGISDQAATVLRRFF